jgi:DHA1 family multidrug resistance protein-like MFS transporter
MLDIFSDSALGQWLRLLRGKQLARCPDEFFNFKLPTEYSKEKPSETDQKDKSAPRTANEIKEGRSQIVASSDEDAPTESNDGKKDITLVTWYSDDDPDNSHNWSFLKKIWIALLLLVYTISVYIGSSVYTASEPVT